MWPRKETTFKAEQMAEWIKCLLYKHEGLNLGLQHKRQDPVVWMASKSVLGNSNRIAKE